MSSSCLPCIWKTERYFIAYPDMKMGCQISIEDLPVLCKHWSDVKALIGCNIAHMNALWSVYCKENLKKWKAGKAGVSNFLPQFCLKKKHHRQLWKIIWKHRFGLPNYAHFLFCYSEDGIWRRVSKFIKSSKTFNSFWGILMQAFTELTF